MTGHRPLGLCVLFVLCSCSLSVGRQEGAANAQKAEQPQSTTSSGKSTVLIPVKTKQPKYPQEASRNSIQGQVRLKLDVSEEGEVEKVDIISGDPVLAKAAVAAAKKWTFKPKIEDGKPVRASTELAFDFYVKGKLMQGGQSEDRTATTNSPPNYPPANVLSSGDTASSRKSTSEDGIPLRTTVSAGVAQGMLVHQVAPVYPPAARRNYIQGSVVLQAVIGKDGRIANLQPVSGPKELIPAAVAAVQQWRYKPFVLRGEVVEVQTQITVNFQLR